MWRECGVCRKVINMEKDFVKFRLRQRESGLTAIFLSYYYKGKRREESLRLYLVPENNAADKKKNKDTWRIAEMVKARRLTELNAEVFQLKRDLPKIRLVEFFRELGESKQKEGTRYIWELCRRRLELFMNGKDILLSDVDARFVQRYADYLSKDAICVKQNKGKKLGETTQWGYFQKFQAVINEAVRRKYITDNPCTGVSAPKKSESLRTYLTIEELNQMVDTRCANDDVKRQFLFSCLTGLRYSDIRKLVWGEVSEDNGFTRITFRQKKTSRLQYLDINQQAAKLLGERKSSDELVFAELSQQIINYNLRNWVKAAGINKKITFHCGRHTFATLLLSLGTDLYTVSKLLGHANINTTQIYAKVLDKTRQDAVQKIPDLNL